ncbi:hypothetical protein PSTT_03985 [Puccinia striiformis]|uniref:Uncharacterized protein n=1 Tax=Puccinia striiformis TaxID=27350 RepID=A0A2S4VU97_9BASI|nr:hypothetical protein PSTT_03985 [Puccinia striiformis]
MPTKHKQLKAVCQCVTHGCGAFAYLDNEEKHQPGVQLSLNTVKSHRLDDAKANLARADIPTHLDAKPPNFAEELSSLSLGTLSPASSSRLGPTTHASPQSVDSSQGQTLSNQQAPNQLQEPLNQYNPIYDCSRYFMFSLKSASPTSVYVALVAAILSIVKHCSTSTTTWFLKSQQDFLHLILRRSTTPSDQLAYHELSLIQEIPHCIGTVIQWLELDPVVTYVVCCSQCFAMYPILPDTPRRCIHKFLSNPTTSKNLEDKDATPNPTSPNFTVCSAPLYKTRGIHQVPLRKYGFQSLQDWLARLFSRPHIEEALEQTATRSRIPFNPAGTVKDIHDSQAWKQFSGPDGNQFTSSSHNLTFSLYTDAINAFGNRQAGKHASITFLVLICLTLPVELRFRPENIFIAGIAPGPKEPSLEQINWILQPVVQQLNRLWNPGLRLSRTHKYPGGRHIFGALLTFLGDLPAVRRALGFSSTSSNHVCSYCLLTLPEITNFNSTSWPKRNTVEHQKWAREWRDAKSLAEREKIFTEHGVRYSALLELPYWDIVSFHCVDSMHNLLLGLLKWHCQRLWAMEDVPNDPDPGGVSTRELVDLLMDAAQPRPHPPHLEPNTEEIRSSQDQIGLGLLFDDGSDDVDSVPSFDDEDFSPPHDDDGWQNDWATLSDGEISLDMGALAYINARLPRINAPSWIKQLLPVLGKASHGRLKADEWRNLFTIQLPLILPLYWQEPHAQNLSLIHNFSHLVSLVQLGLMRETSSAIIVQYRHHLISYLESSVKLFGPLVAPNHHMAIHLAECLEKFGPVRSWGPSPRAAHGTRELEITFLKAFCQLGNLRALLASDCLPDELEPFTSQLRPSSQPQRTFPEATDPCSKAQILPSQLFSQLVNKINTIPLGDDCIYVEADKWQQDMDQRMAPINARVENLSSFHLDNDLTYSTYTTSPKNSIIEFRLITGKTAFGRIAQIFKHRRVTHKKTVCFDTWFVIHSFPDAQPKSKNPFAKLYKYPFKVALCSYAPQTHY